jgi:hypothetical protein
MRRRADAAAVYGLTLTLLVSHEIDSAYWREWRLFHLPGGVQLFVLLHLALVPAALEGFRRLLLGLRGAQVFALALGLAAIGAFAIHLCFLALGHDEFRKPLSIVLLVALAVAGAAQLALTLAPAQRPERVAQAQ